MRNTVVITGASSGIGRATALAFARKRARLVLASRRGKALEQVVAECEALGAEAMAVVTDVSDNKQVKALARAALERFGTLDVWVNDASVSAYGSVEVIPLKDFRRVMDVDVMGYVYGSRQALRAFRQTGGGAIINVASIIGEVPQPYAAPYAMAKAAVRALGVSLRQELFLSHDKSITVSTILPPTIDTPFFRHAANYSGRELLAMPPVYPPELVARAIVRAASKPKAEVVVGAAGKTFVNQHRRHPLAIETQMAALTNRSQLSPTTGADRTSGSLYQPPPASDASVTGGWGGASRHAKRKVVFATLALGLAAFVAARLSTKSASR